ncbi:MAG TPA: hypothetical protein VI260_09985 [Blastocatellia bacterium]|jgi:hypothetical protein
MNIQNIIEAAKVAKARTSNKRWQAAIDKAVVGASTWLVTELMFCIVVTTESGQTYRANDKHCQCPAFFNNQACKHRSLYHLLTLAESIETAPKVETKRQAVVTRSIESDRTGVKYNVVRVDGWAI